MEAATSFPPPILFQQLPLTRQALMTEVTHQQILSCRDDLTVLTLVQGVSKLTSCIALVA